jgi:hypothetical protein
MDGAPSHFLVAGSKGSVLEIGGEEAVDTCESVVGVAGAVAGFVVGIFKGVASVGVDFGVDGLAELLH